MQNSVDSGCTWKSGGLEGEERAPSMYTVSLGIVCMVMSCLFSQILKWKMALPYFQNRDLRQRARLITQDYGAVECHD